MMPRDDPASLDPAGVPTSWRNRFGAGLADLLDELEQEGGRIPVADRLDVARAGLAERLASVRHATRHPRVLVACGLALSVVVAGALAAVESDSPPAPIVRPPTMSTPPTTQPQVSQTGAVGLTASTSAAAEAAAQAAGGTPILGMWVESATGGASE